MASPIEYMLVLSVVLGLIAASVITFQHMMQGNHRAYDNWLLPVFLAVALQIYNGRYK